MNLRVPFLLLGLSCAVACGFAAADGSPGTRSERKETELEQTMGRMGKAWRQVRKANREGTLTPALAENVATVRKNAELAVKLTPALEAERPEAERAKFQSDYEAQLKKLIATLGTLEAALAANDTPKASKLIADVSDLMKAGHSDFKKSEDRNKQ